MTNYRRSRDGNCYFFTVITGLRRCVFDSEKARLALHSAIEMARAKRPFAIEAMVLLPDHLHCVWTLPEGDNDYSTRWASIKSAFSRKADEFLVIGRVSGSMRNKRERGVWQRRFWEHQIRDDDDFRAHCDYIHYNPVKHGLAMSPWDWEFSTFRRFVGLGIYDRMWGGAGLQLPEIVSGE